MVGWGGMGWGVGWDGVESHQAKVLFMFSSLFFLWRCDLRKGYLLYDSLPLFTLAWAIRSTVSLRLPMTTGSNPAHPPLFLLPSYT